MKEDVDTLTDYTLIREGKKTLGYKTFEELQAYQLARAFRKEIFKLIKLLPEEEKYNLSSQMRRAATSLTNNIAEGHGRFHYQENIQFCRQSRGSLSELIDDLNICEDQGYIPQPRLRELKGQGYRVSQCLNGYISYLRRRKTEDA